MIKTNSYEAEILKNDAFSWPSQSLFDCFVWLFWFLVIQQNSNSALPNSILCTLIECVFKGYFKYKLIHTTTIVK